MSDQTDPRLDPDDVQDLALQDEQADGVVGGLNPQPLPPGIPTHLDDPTTAPTP